MCLEIIIVKDINVSWVDSKSLLDIDTQKEFQDFFQLRGFYLESGYKDDALQSDMCLCPIDVEKTLKELNRKYKFTCGSCLVEFKEGDKL
jgi:hypothetical protein